MVNRARKKKRNKQQLNMIESHELKKVCYGPFISVSFTHSIAQFSVHDSWLVYRWMVSCLLFICYVKRLNWHIDPLNIINGSNEILQTNENVKYSLLHCSISNRSE